MTLMCIARHPQSTIAFCHADASDIRHRDDRRGQMSTHIIARPGPGTIVGRTVVSGVRGHTSDCK